MSKRKSKLIKSLIITASVIAFLGLVLLFFVIGENYASEFERVTPSYDKVDLNPILAKDTLSDEDYATVYAQTGLTRIGYEDMLKEYGKDGILELQEAFFKEYGIHSYNFAPFCYYHTVKGKMPMVPLKNGDIIVSSSTEFSWWSVGHCAMVVDAENGVIVEAIGVGDDSTYGYTSALSKRGDFIVLRPNIDEAALDKIVDYVNTELIGIPYDPTIGVLSRKYNEEIPYTQCAHIFWFAFFKHGFDIDSNGGSVVTPKDISNSKYFDIVQVSGFDLESLWSD